MSTFKTQIKGLAELKAKLEKYNKDLSVGVDNILSQGAEFMAATARRNAPVGRTGALGGFIKADVNGPSKTVTAFAPYAPYVEFGTGSRVFDNRIGYEFAPEVKDFAKEFYVNGKGKMPATPFFFPALDEAKVKIINDVKKLFGL